MIFICQRSNRHTACDIPAHLPLLTTPVVIGSMASRHQGLKLPQSASIPDPVSGHHNPVRAGEGEPTRERGCFGAAWLKELHIPALAQEEHHLDDVGGLVAGVPLEGLAMGWSVAGYLLSVRHWVIGRISHPSAPFWCGPSGDVVQRLPELLCLPHAFHALHAYAKSVTYRFHCAAQNAF